MAYKFIKLRDAQNPSDATNVTIEVMRDSDLRELIEAFQDFLHACGFAPTELEIVESRDTKEPEWD